MRCLNNNNNNNNSNISMCFQYVYQVYSSTCKHYVFTVCVYSISDNDNTSMISDTKIQSVWCIVILMLMRYCEYW